MRIRSISIAIAIAACALSSPARPAPAPTAECLGTIARWPYGETFAISSSGSRFLYSSGSTLLVVDSTEHTPPSAIGRVSFPSTIWQLWEGEGFALVRTADEFLRVVRLEDPRSPVESGRLAIDESITAIGLSGRFAYLTTRQGQLLMVIDLSDLDHPRIVGDLCLDGTPEGAAIIGNRLSISVAPVGLESFDISVPSAPALRSTYAGEGAVGHSLATSGNRLFVLSREALFTFDQSNPDRPQLLGAISGGFGHQFVASGSIGMLADWDYIKLFDLSGGGVPAAKATIKASWGPLATTSANFAAYVDDFGFHLLDARDPARPAEIAALPNVRSRAFSPSGSRAAIGGGDGPVGILDLSDKGAPRLETVFFPDDYVIDVALEGTTLFAVLSSSAFLPSKLEVFDVATPGSAPRISSLSFASLGSVNRVVAIGNTVFVGTRGASVTIFDVSNPARPKQISSIDAGGRGGSFSIASNFLFLNADPGFQIFDISDAAHPVEIGRFASPRVESLSASGNLAALGTSSGLTIVDASSPSSPVAVGFVPLENGAYHVFLDGKTAFFQTWFGGYGTRLVAADVSDPARPRVVASRVRSSGDEFVAQDGLLYVTDGGGLDILEPGCPLVDLPPPTADFDCIPLHPRVGLTVTCYDRSIGFPAEWSWDFGDGSSPNSRAWHAYPLAGSYDVTFETANSSGSSRKTRPLEIAAGLARPLLREALSAGFTILPAAAAAPGRNGATWTTEVSAFWDGYIGSSEPDRGADPDQKLLGAYFLTEGADNSAAEGISLAVERGGNALIDDFVRRGRGNDPWFGALLINDESDHLAVSARIDDNCPAGTCGEFVPAIRSRDRIFEGDTAILAGLRHDEFFRSTIGIVNTTDGPIEIEVVAKRANGTRLEQEAFALAPFGVKRITSIFERAAPIEDAIVEIRASTPGSSFVAWGATVDNRSGDPDFRVAESLSRIGERRELVVPIVAHVDGSAEDRWRTTLRLLQPGSDSAAKLRFCQPGLCRDATVATPAGTLVTISDLIPSLFPDALPNAAGSLTIETSSGIFAGTWIENRRSNGTFRQFVPAKSRSELEAHPRARLLHLRRDRNFRTNIGVTSTATSPTAARVGLYDELGHFLAGAQFHLAPGEIRRFDDAFTTLGASESVRRAHAEVWCDAGCYGWASVVDSESGDGTFIPAEPTTADRSFRSTPEPFASVSNNCDPLPAGVISTRPAYPSIGCPP